MDKKAMKKSNGGISNNVSYEFKKAGVQYLNAGRRPKKAMKVRREMEMVEIRIARMKDIVKMRWHSST